MNEIKTVSKIIHGQELVFCNLRGLFWAEEKMLIISDLHVGKTAHFRKHGIAVPSEVLSDDLERLAAQIIYFTPKKLLIVGDFWHAGHNSDFEIFQQWTLSFPTLQIILVKGNHDRFAEHPLQQIGVSVIENQWLLSPFLFSHEPLSHNNHVVISGHIHPGVLLRLKSKIFYKLPCFAIQENQIILPAFSRFTGLDLHTLDDNFQKIVVDQDFIIEL